MYMCLICFSINTYDRELFLEFETNAAIHNVSRLSSKIQVSNYSLFLVIVCLY